MLLSFKCNVMKKGWLEKNTGELQLIASRVLITKVEKKTIKKVF